MGEDEGIIVVVATLPTELIEDLEFLEFLGLEEIGAGLFLAAAATAAVLVEFLFFGLDGFPLVILSVASPNGDENLVVDADFPKSVVETLSPLGVEEEVRVLIVGVVFIIVGEDIESSVPSLFLRSTFCC